MEPWNEPKALLFKNSKPAMSSHTDRIHRILVLWIDLQRAVCRTGSRQFLPWDCPDEEVARLWELITRPQNEALLEEWLYQSATGELELWAQHALLACRRRRGASR
jgi:hypothetical protein